MAIQGAWFLSVFMFGLPVWCAKNCGTIDVEGYDGPVSVITTEWNLPNDSAGDVFVKDGKVVPHMSGRSYLGDACTEGEGKYNNSEYVAFKLLGKRLRYTINLAGALCGCNAALYLTSLQQNDNESGCSDYYCDANAVCGVRCAEIDIQEANERGWHSTLHVAADGAGAGKGTGGGGKGWSGPRDWSPKEYGPGGTCIDTKKPFQVEAAFPVDAEGILLSMDMTLSQEGGSHPLKVSIDKYAYKAENAMPEVSLALKEGMAPIISYWKSDDMLWLDGQGEDGKGPCVSDNTTFENCSDSVQFYDFSISDIPTPPSGEFPLRLIPLFGIFMAVVGLLVVIAMVMNRGQ